MTLEKCSRCGLCKANCAVFKAVLDETISARGRAILIDKNITSEIFFACSLCEACKTECPEEIDLPEEIQKMRKKMNNMNLETKPNKKMIENIRKHGNPYGKVEKGEKPKDLYCC